MRYESTDWALEIPDGWHHEEGDSCVAFYHPDGVGAFQVSSYRKDDVVTDDDLLEFAGDVPLAAVSFGLLRGFRTQFSEGHKFWTKWWLRAGRQMIHATYNCSLSDHGFEDAEVRAMLESLNPEY
ncbi:MAG: hypothetical protein AB1705_27100 [Verrucomicrobiota bacterium]